VGDGVMLGGAVAVGRAYHGEDVVSPVLLIIKGGLEAVLLIVALAAQHLKDIEGVLFQHIESVRLRDLPQVGNPVRMGENPQTASFPDLPERPQADRIGALVHVFRAVGAVLGIHDLLHLPLILIHGHHIRRLPVQRTVFQIAALILEVP